jgi:hypothetical protein
MLGSLYGDASGNGPANGAAWDPSTTSWRLRAGNASAADRFERCARWMVANDVGGNAGAKVARRNNSVTLTDFWPAGRGVPFPHGQMTTVVTQASPLGKRAFIMSVIEGEGEVCDPSNATCATAQIADNSRTIGGGTNPQFYEHIVALRQPAIDAGLTSAFTATGKGCVPQTVDQLAAASRPLCIRSNDFAVIKDWPVATCNASQATATWPATPAASPTLLHRRRHHPRCRCASTRPRSPSEDQHPDLGRRRRHGLPSRRRVVGERGRRRVDDGHADHGRHADLHPHLRHRRARRPSPRST